MNHARWLSNSAPTGARQYNVIAASDFSALGDRAVIEALRFCAPHRSAALHVITVGAPSAEGIIMPGQRHLMSDDDAHEAARARLAHTVEQFVTHEQPLETSRLAYYVTVGSPAERIITLANVVDADLIVLGTHNRQGLERVIMGSVTAEVVQNAPCGVYVIRPRDFLEGEKLPEIQPPLRPGEHSLLRSHFEPAPHIHRLNLDTTPIMP